MSESRVAKVAKALEGMSRYDPNQASTFQDYLQMQATNGFYDPETNYALLTIYRYWPETLDEYYAGLVLLKSMMELPLTDFSLCKILITDLETDNLRKIINLGVLLESCNFIKFWEQCQNLLAQKVFDFQKIHGFETAIQKFICHAIELSFQTIELLHLKQMLNHPSDDELEDIIELNNWKVVPENSQLDLPTSVYTFDHTNVVKGTKVFAGPKLQEIIKLDSIFAAIASELCPNQNWYWRRCLVSRMHNDANDSSVMLTSRAVDVFLVENLRFLDPPYFL
ncbi:hypothetical protein GJ496_005472 [Pomphorhynchus laevis]|nr:hypothetical protein GJ496_005472 [Pomphorhynchus laevis]